MRAACQNGSIGITGSTEPGGALQLSCQTGTIRITGGKLGLAGVGEQTYSSVRRSVFTSGQMFSSEQGERTLVNKGTWCTGDQCTEVQQRAQSSAHEKTPVSRGFLVLGARKVIFSVVRLGSRAVALQGGSTSCRPLAALCR